MLYSGSLILDHTHTDISPWQSLATCPPVTPDPTQLFTTCFTLCVLSHGHRCAHAHPSTKQTHGSLLLTYPLFTGFHITNHRISCERSAVLISVDQLYSSSITSALHNLGFSSHDIHKLIELDILGYRRQFEEEQCTPCYFIILSC